MSIEILPLRIQLLMIASLALVAAGASTVVSVAQEEHGNPEAAKLENPIAMTPESLEAGETLFMRRCRGCHGSDAMGGPPKEAGEAPTPNLVDHEYEYGSSDGEIFYVIQNGVPPDSSWSRMTTAWTRPTPGTWFNYIRSLQQAHHDE